MRKKIKKKKNMIIGGLLALIFLMSVGYAAFASNLTITGTANTSSWIIKITNIREKTHTGGADTVNTSFTDLSASFSSTLTQPGDSITYEVTVENMGNIDASLKKVTKTFTQNKYIDVTYSGLLEGQMLYKQGGAGSTAVMEVTVTFKDIEIESLTDTITSNITISLDFEQEGNNVDTTKKYLIEYDTRGGNNLESRYFGLNDTCLICGGYWPTRLGYHSDGWYTILDDGVKKYVNITTSVSDIILDNTKEGAILYASWSENMYSIIFDSQGGTEVRPSASTWDNPISIHSNTSKGGYVFDSWYTEPNGGGLKIISGSTKTSEVVQAIYGKYTDVAGGVDGKEITIYANWVENEYVNVKYMPNDSRTSRASNMPADKTVKCTDVNFIEKTPIRNNYTFAGWYIDSTEVTNDKSIKELLGICPQKVTIDARWTKNS